MRSDAVFQNAEVAEVVKAEHQKERSRFYVAKD